MLEKVLFVLVFSTVGYCYQEEFIANSIIFGNKYLFMFGGLLAMTGFRYMTKTTRIATPYAVFTIALGMLWGVGALFFPWMNQRAVVATEILRKLHYIYMPCIIFSTSFVVDAHAFFKSLPQILIIAGPVAFLSSTATGFTMSLLLDANWTEADAVLFGVTSSSIYPVHTIRWLQETTVYTKHAIVLLEGETIISASFSWLMHGFISNNITGWLIWWYQFVTLVLFIFVLGIPLSYCYGLFGASLMRLAYNDAVGLMLLTVSMCYTTFFFMRWTVHAGIVGTMIVGIVMGLERASLSNEMEKMLIGFWSMLTCIINGVLFINIGVMAPSLLQSGLSFSDYIFVFVTYLVTNITRFLSFFLFFPILSRIGYGMSFQNMIICVWSGLKNPICLNMVLDLYDETYKDDPKKAQFFFLHTLAVYLLLLFINGSCVPFLMKALNLSEITMSRQINMNNCMKYVTEARARTIAILKMDRFLSDANWPLVMASTALKHPYKLQATENQEEEEVEDEEEEERELFLGYRYTFCPDCQKDVPNEPTPKEMKDMTREAKLRILKLKKTAYSRQYENGMMSQEGIRIQQQSVEIAMDSEELVIELDGLFNLFAREGILYRFLRNRLQYFLRTTDESYKSPRRRWRRNCYRIVNHTAFYVFINVIVVTHIAMVVLHLVTDSVVHFSNHLFFCIYFAEFWLKIFALSWIHICRHGFHSYFRSYWNIIEFTTLIFTFITALVHDIIQAYAHLVLDWIFIVLLAIRILRILGLLKMSACCHSLTPTMIKYLDTKVDRYRTLAYELGKNYVAGEEEILENLHHIVDNDKIREDVKQRSVNDKLAVTKRIGLAQKEWPCVATTVKTKLAMNTILNKMREDVQELKVSGWVDDVEFSKLLNTLNERYNYIQTIKTIQPSSPKVIFREVPYMGADKDFVEFLFTNVATKKFDPGDVVVNDGDILEGIYILITGMFRVEYTPTPEVVKKLKDLGALPIVDHITSLTYEEPLSEYILSGNTIGELSVLTDRDYNGTIVAETHSQVYILNRRVLKKAFMQDDDPVNGLECRIWKYVSFRKALTVMMNVPSYRSYSQEKIKFILERSFMPNLSNYKVFVVNEMMEDIVLIEGVVVDFNTRDIYTGPCYIPRAVQKLVLPKSSLVSIEVPIETKLLIIPAKDYDEYEIMVTEEETCELLNDDTTKCLRHIIQGRAALTTKGSKSLGVVGGVRKRLAGTESNKSRITFVSSKTS